jgi:hypothetical protein
MHQPIISLSPGQRTAFDLNAFVAHANALHQLHCATCTTPVPKTPRRWLSRDRLTPRTLELTLQGDVEGGIKWLSGATIAFSFTPAICAPLGHPRRPWLQSGQPRLLEGEATVKQYIDDARVCDALRHPLKGRGYRELAGLPETRRCRKGVDPIS